ncbi:MAG: hypothetical protein HND57_15145 [Planctomycetes bacterium]|nr:hypothetical protein [Planctomycetota bacterium]
MDLLDRLLAHNEWATRVLLEHCVTLSADDFTRDFEIGPGSLHSTLAHTIGCMHVWADIVRDGRLDDDHSDIIDRCSTPNDLLTELAAAHTSLTQALTHTRNNRTNDDILNLEHEKSGKRYRFTYGSMAGHVLTHGMHHRAQILVMLRKLGQPDLPDIDMLEWELRESVGSEEPLA